MTNPHVDLNTQPRRPEASAAATAEPDLFVSAAPPQSRAVGVARTGVSVARRGASGIAARLPVTLTSTRAGVRGAMGVLQTLPDSTLRSLAATSVGVGFGLYLARTRRLGVLAGVVPAALIGAAIVARPATPRLALTAGRPAAS